jgi:hypothetical protein
MSEFVWKFPSNDSGESEGPNDAGITHFTSNRLGGVIRESIQNSLDARRGGSQPVKVEISLTSLPPESFAADSLAGSLRAAAHSPHNDDAHKAQFCKGYVLLSPLKPGGGGGGKNPPHYRRQHHRGGR